MFDLTKEEYEDIIEELMLNDELSEILEMKIKGCSIIQIAMKLNMSESTVKRRIRLLKKKIIRVL